MIWLTGGALAFCALMMAGILALIVSLGMSTFWPGRVVRWSTPDGRVYMGEITRTERVPGASAQRPDAGAAIERTLIRTGNFQITQNHFNWIDDSTVSARELPPWAVVFEKIEWGRFYGFPRAFGVIHSTLGEVDAEGRALETPSKNERARALAAAFQPSFGGVPGFLVKRVVNGRAQETFVTADQLDEATDVVAVAEVAMGPEAAWSAYRRFHGEVRERYGVRRRLERDDTGAVNRAQEDARLALKSALLALDGARASRDASAGLLGRRAEAAGRAGAEYASVTRWAEAEFARLRKDIDEINAKNSRYRLEVETAGEGSTPPRVTSMGLADIVRAYPANQLGFRGKLRVYGARWWEFVSGDPREANSEGGVYPAIFGTVVMTLVMALAAVPFGVLAALYLREYARSGLVVSTVRIAVNNLAGVPSIVFGVFGLGFFCYGLGAFIDGGPSHTLPASAWWPALAATGAIGVAAIAMRSVGRASPGTPPTPGQRARVRISIALWVACAASALVLVGTTPFFDGFFRAGLPNPTFGKGALLWASLTLALLTLPVVIVATEEALAAVPNSMREGSYACGASKWQTIRRIVLPRAMPGIMTGMILAMARGAGEVAPLMLVGAVKLAPELPFDWQFPFGVHRSFMHLGFHIYDVGFQSQNSEAAKPMVFTTTLLLIVIIALLNVGAVAVRTRLRRKFVADQF